MAWHFICFEGADGFVAFAKRGPFKATTVAEAIAEPGDVWFAHGDTHDEALAAVKAEVLH